MNNKGLIITASSLFAVIIVLIMHLALWADDVAYRKAVKTNKAIKYKEFLEKYPNSEFASEAQARYEECAYRYAVKTNTKEGYKSFLDNHPNSIYADSVKLIFEEYAYEAALSSDNIQLCCDFIKDYPNSENAPIIEKKLDELEKQFYKKNINIPVEKIVRNHIYQYERWFPDGKYSKQVANKRLELDDYEEFYAAKLSNTKDAWQNYLDKRPKGRYASHARAKIREYEEREYYLTYSLSNGAQPYASRYGYNSSCDYWGCSSIIINAPYNSDVVTLIKNSRGNVVRHAYIRAGRSYTFEVPNGTYQPFFYYGKGWYPKKAMAKGLKGGFLTNETHSYVKSTYLDDQEWTITLQLTYNGNLSTQPCSENDLF